MQINGKNNTVATGANLTLSLNLSGDNNVIEIGDARVPSTLSLYINGDNNWVVIGDFYQIKGLNITCGNHVKAHRTALRIGRQISIEPGCSFLLYNSGNSLTIGDDCLFSNGITIRCGESPHLIFDSQTGEYLDVSAGVVIGDHVWIGERVYINKRAAIPAGCIVAACGVVTKKCEEENCVIGGNPARIVKKNVHWIRNSDFLAEGSVYRRKFDEYKLSQDTKVR